jgi:hypothetical protein
MTSYPIPQLQHLASERYRAAIDYLHAISAAQGDSYVEEIAGMMLTLLEGRHQAERQSAAGAIRAEACGNAQELLEAQRLRFQREQEQC